MDFSIPQSRIGILGGTFDPIHYGHLIIAETAREQLGLDRVLFIPSGNSYMKQEVSDSIHRYHMTKLAISDNPYFSISDMEINRLGPTYTYETLMSLKQINPADQYYFIVGADTLFSISSWKCPEIVLKNCTLAVSIREGYQLDHLQAEIENLRHTFHADISVFTTERYDISSTVLKEKIKNQQSVKYWIPDPVIQYIKKNYLYQNHDK